ncbi:hypothetical protein ACS77P_19055 [Yersinia enterocolitica]|uniref:hypothetical protein n=1 Tax=Yersinia enterocolitica TaxID=630 RepID=UPI003F42CC53
MSGTTALLMSKSALTYLDWNNTAIESAYRYHADGTYFNGEVSCLFQEVNQAGKRKIDSSYYKKLNEMQEGIKQYSLSEIESAGNKIYIIDLNKVNNSAKVSYFNYNLNNNKLSESQVFHYQNNELTSRTLFVHDPNSRGNGGVTKSERFDVNNKLVERNTFSYKPSAGRNDEVTIEKEIYHGDDVTRTTNKEIYNFFGVKRTELYDKNNNIFESNDFSYFRNGKKCQTEKSTFNSSGEVSHKDKMVYKKNGDLFGRVQSNYNNEGILKDAKLTYYNKGVISRVIEGECSSDGKTIIDVTGKIYDITTGKFINGINSVDSINGEINEIRLKSQVNESKIFEQGSKSNSSHSGASTPAPAETRVKRELLDSKPIKHYEIIDGERFLVTKNGPVVDNGTRVQEARRGNSRFIADITSEYQNGNVVLKTTRVREVDSVTKKHSVTGKYETQYIYDSNNKLDHTFTKSEFYDPDKKQIGLREQRVKNGEIIYDGILRYHSDGSSSFLFLNGDGNYESTNWGADNKIGQPSVRQSSTVHKTGLPIPPLNSDTINQKATPTTEYPGQLADAINHFPDRERTLTPAPVENAVNGVLGPRNLVPVMNYASRL